MIYELDLTARELQTLKDHYFVMEKCLREEIRLDFVNDLNNKGILINKYKEDFSAFRKEINIELQEEVAREINEIDLKVKSKAYGGVVPH